MTARDERATFWRGRCAVRTYCPAHPLAQTLRSGDDALCVACRAYWPLCRTQFGTKECVREHGHDAACVSPSGSSWHRDLADYTPPEITHVGRIGSAPKCGPKEGC